MIRRVSFAASAFSLAFQSGPSSTNFPRFALLVFDIHLSFGFGQCSFGSAGDSAFLARSSAGNVCFRPSFFRFHTCYLLLFDPSRNQAPVGMRIAYSVNIALPAPLDLQIRPFLAGSSLRAIPTGFSHVASKRHYFVGHSSCFYYVWCDRSDAPAPKNANIHLANVTQ
jgi:hypothetical protein